MENFVFLHEDFTRNPSRNPQGITERETRKSLMCKLAASGRNHPSPLLLPLKTSTKTRYRSHYTLGVKILFTGSEAVFISSVCVDEIKIEIEWKQSTKARR
jgi:hypothetical protein